MASSDAAIDSSLLSKAYTRNGPLAVADLTLRVEAGCVFGFLGPNGAGKTTVLKMLLGLTAPSSGRASLFGVPIGTPKSRRRIGYLPELFRYPAWLSARETLAFHAPLAGVIRSARDAEIERTLALVGLKNTGNRHVGAFSKGMQQRLGLGIALLGDPRLVFLDEPTSALDPVGRVDVRDIIRTLKEAGTTVFINSHLLTEVERICDRVAFFRSGSVIAEGSIADVVRAPGGVSIRTDGADDADITRALRPFGVPEFVSGEIRLAEIDSDRVPDVVAALVAAGIRIREVRSTTYSLEERFLELMSPAC
jgi:ABC-2 type transport system ATP-binding protein